MTARVGRRRAAERWSLLVIAVSLIALLVPTGTMAAGQTARPPGAPHAGVVPDSVGLTRAALASLAPRPLPTGSWSNVTSSVGPAPAAREGEALVYDPAGPYVLLFGGATGAGAVHDTWIFTHDHWTNVTRNLTVSPASRYKAAIAYDTVDGYVVLFGGRSNSYFNDTWIWQNNRWRLDSTSVAPSPREDAMVAYDATDGYVLLFGGEDTSLTLLNDTWTFHAGNWTNTTSLSSVRPPTREAGGMTWDAGDGYVVLFGGSNDPRGDLRDTWTYKGGVWTNITGPASTSPAKRETLMLADDPVDGYVLMFGGLRFPNSVNDSWGFSAGAWTQLATSPAPPPMWGAELVWDPNGGAGFDLLFGGVASPATNASLFNATWQFKVPLTVGLAVFPGDQIDAGESADLTVTPTGGYAPYTVGITSDLGDCVLIAPGAYTCTPAGPGVYHASAYAVDSNANNQTSATSTITVVPDPIPTAQVAPSRGSPPLVVAYSVTLAGGTAPFQFLWTFGDGGNATTANGSHTYAKAGTYHPTLSVVDATGFQVNASGIPAVELNASLSVQIAAAPTRGVSPLPVEFTSTVRGGFAPYQYAWTFGPVGVVSSLPDPSYTYPDAGTFLVTLNVSDSTGASTTASTTVTVTSPAALAATASANVTSGTAPLTVGLTASASGGTAPYAFSWSFGDGSAAVASSDATHTYTVAGTYTATVTVTDAAEEQAQATVSVAVAPSSAGPLPFNASFVESLGTPYCVAGSAVAQLGLNGTAAGGSGPYTYAWVIDGARYTQAVLTVLVPAGATTTFSYNASDSVGHVASHSGSVTVPALSCSSTSASGRAPPNYLLIALIVIVALVVAVEAYLLLRKQK